MSFTNSLIIATKFKGKTSLNVIEDTKNIGAKLQTQEVIFDFLKTSADIESLDFTRFRTHEYNSIYGVLIDAKFKDESKSRLIGMAPNNTLGLGFSKGDNAMNYDKASSLIGALTLEGTLGHTDSALEKRGRTLADLPVIAIIEITTLDSGKSSISRIATNDPVFTYVRANRHSGIPKGSTEKCLFNDNYSINKTVKGMLSGLSERDDIYGAFTAGALCSLDGAQIDLTDTERTEYSVLIDPKLTKLLSERVSSQFYNPLGLEEYIGK